MDPNATYYNMLESFRDGDWDTARESALMLRVWIKNKGFYPTNITKEATDQMIANILEKTKG